MTKIAWEAETPSKTWVKAQLRFANTQEDLEKSTWIGVEGERSWFGNHQEVRAKASAGAWIQYRLALGATNSGCTPRVTEVNIHYSKSR